MRLNGGSRSLSMTDDRSNDQGTIAVWVSDLNRLAESLGVRSVIPAWPPLIVNFQGCYLELVTWAFFPGFLDDTQQPESLGYSLSRLDSAIENMNHAKDSPSVKAIPAKALFASVSTLLTTIRVRSLFCDGELQAHLRPGFQ